MTGQAIGVSRRGDTLAAIAHFASVAGVLATWFAARKLGDVAAQRACQKLNHAKVGKASKAALRSRLAEVERIRLGGLRYASIGSNDLAPPIIRLPVGACETAFVAI